MNTNNNKRFQQTEEKILRTFGQLATSKGIDKVTVSDICRQAGIHRTTFYGHYSDIFALRRVFEQFPARMILERMHAEKRWGVREGLMELMEFYRKNRKIILRNLLEGQPDPGANAILVRRIFPSQWKQEYQRGYMELYHLSSPEEMEYHRTAFEAGVQAVIQKWLCDGCREEPEKIIEILAGVYSF